jgi:hypothetical protein
MGIPHRTHFKQPAVLPFICIYLYLEIKMTLSECNTIIAEERYLIDQICFVLFGLFGDFRQGYYQERVNNNLS